MTKKLLRGAVVALIWLLIWSLASFLVGHEVLLPSPLAVLKALMALLKTSDYYISAALSLLRVVAGFLFGAAAGILLGALMRLSVWLKAFFTPLMTVIRATPVASFILLLFVWVSKNNVPVFTSLLIVAPIVSGSLLSGLDQTDKNLIEMTSAFELSKSARLRRLYIPSVLPHLSSASSVSLGMAWKAGTAAEVICNPEYGIGARLYDTKIYLEVPTLFAFTVTVILLSFLLERLFGMIIKRQKKRRRADD